MSDKMDRQGVRTATDLEQKYQFGKSFAEVMGIAQDAQETAQKAVSSSSKLDESLTAEEIYNRLTNNGQSQGLYRDDNGNLYVNAAYIYALETMFAKSVSVSAEFFLEPEQEEVEAIQKHLLLTEIIPIDKIPLYDFNGDGKITILDLSKAQKAALGLESLANWSGAVKSTVTMTLNMSNPEKAIHIQGKNMWGRDIDRYIGINFSNIKQKGLADYVVEEGTNNIWTYRKWASGKAECWGRNHITASMSQVTGNTFYYLNTSFWETDYPFEFVDVPCEVVSYHAPSTHMGWAYSQWENTQSRSGRYCAMRWNSVATEADVYLDYYVIGKWK